MPLTCLSFILTLILRFSILVYCILMSAIHLLAVSVPIAGGMWNVFQPENSAYLFFIIGLLFFYDILKSLCCCKKGKAPKVKERRTTIMSFNQKAIVERGWFKVLRFHLVHDDGVFGRRGKYFGSILFLMECYEVPSQTYQAYTISRISVSPYPALICGFAITLSCFGVAFIEFYRNATNRLASTSRLLCLDIATDILISMLIPLYTVLGPLIAVVTDFTAFTDDEIGTAFLTGGEIATITSLTDMIIRIFPLVIAFSNLRFLETNWHEIALAEKIQNTNTSTKSAPAINEDIQVSKPEILSTRKLKLFIFLPTLIVWGFVVGFESIKAFSQESCHSELHQRHCIIKSSSWFQSGECTCLVLRYDCTLSGHLLDLKNLSVNVVDEFSREVRRFDVEYCPIKTFPESFAELAHLRMTYLTALNMTKITFDMSKLREITLFKLSHMPLEELPQTLPNSLVMLICIVTRIGTFPELPYENLHVVYAGLNPNITAIPPFFYKLPSLVELHMRNNSITEISSDIKHSHQLQKLELSGNHIKTIPEEIKTLKNLRVLYLDGNLIEQVPWSKEELIEWNTNPKGVGAGHFLFKDISIAHNLVCHAGSSDNLEDTIACEDLCSIGCTRESAAGNACDLLCDNKACNFSNQQCRRDFAAEGQT